MYDFNNLARNVRHVPKTGVDVQPLARVAHCHDTGLGLGTQGDHLGRAREQEKKKNSSTNLQEAIQLLLEAVLVLFLLIHGDGQIAVHGNESGE
jgi:hypothetical protein